MLTAPAPASGMSEPLVFEGMTKRYGAVTVLDDVSVTLEPGRIHALMGENGAGKSTFIKLIAGVVSADSMRLRKGPVEIPLHSAADAAAAGFRFIHQELNIVPQLSVAENILLGHRTPRRFGILVNWREMAMRARDALGRLGVDHIDVRGHAGDLGTGDRMLIRLASSLVADEVAAPCLYVLDEPTAALKDTEVEKLFSVIRGLRDNGAAILYVSHRITEITELCDDVSVLRNGKLIRTCKIRETNKDRLVRDMTGKDLGDTVPPRTSAVGTQSVARLRGVASAHLEEISLDIAQGEVVGIVGLAGAGQTELLRVFLGLEKIHSGEASYLNRSVPASPSAAWANGIAYVPQERRSEGLMMRMSVRPNVILPHLLGIPAGIGRERRRTRELSEQVKLKAEGSEQSVWQLSGGNQQKVVFARAVGGRPRLLLLDEPTRGVDIGSRFEIYGLVRALASEGCSVLVASSDLPELVGLSDRVLVLDAGRQTGILCANGLTPEVLLNKIYHHQENVTA
ncbi:MAG: sugar ABC transporter ATP-binding protein [Rhodobacteraceae bacterium]|nr:sugar ABC transporter ATP-binding protein [Paracoccaceae bacterium]